ASDVVQEVFLTVSTHIGRFRRSQAGDSFRGWLWTICHNKIRDCYRRLQSRPQAAGGTTANVRLEQLPLAPPDEDSDEGGHEIRLTRRRALLQLRETFEKQVWDAFWLVVVEDRSPADVARELGMSVWAVYKAKSRVLHRLRQELDGLVQV